MQVAGHSFGCPVAGSTDPVSQAHVLRCFAKCATLQFKFLASSQSCRPLITSAPKHQTTTNNNHNHIGPHTTCKKPTDQISKTSSSRPQADWHLHRSSSPPPVISPKVASFRLLRHHFQRSVLQVSQRLRGTGPQETPPPVLQRSNVRMDSRGCCDLPPKTPHAYSGTLYFRASGRLYPVDR